MASVVDDKSKTHSQRLYGCVRDASIQAQLLTRSDSWSSREFRSHWHTLRRLFEDIAIDAVVCIEGRPTVSLLDGTPLRDTEIEDRRKKLWNLGATTLLIVENPSQVQVFSTLAKPSKDDLAGVGALLTTETIKTLETIELSLRMRQMVRRIETGAIYRDNKPLFERKNTIDQLLLENLRAARNQICPNRSERGYQRAHALIGKFLFSCYLLDRGIIGPAYLRKRHLPEASDMLGLLNSHVSGRDRTLDSLFQALQHDFNGSLFGNHHTDVVTEKEVEYLQRFLTGENLEAKQLTLFKLYDFSFIPVELISSIYQEFLLAEAEAATTTTRRNQPRNYAQRVQGTYYTPPRLAELTVDIATENWDSLLDKRCLDPACGSGVFLVILFVRMAEEWRQRNPKATTERRYTELMRLLTENLCGVDIHLTACLVTCFSLYLAFLDQMEPKEIVELQEALERNSRAKLLPRILWEHGRRRPRTPHLDSIRELDFFAMAPVPEFDLVVGNPPWVSRKVTPSAEEWLFSEKNNPGGKGLRKGERNQILFPAKELACAFMWKAGFHLREKGRVCQVLPSRVFLSNNTDRFQTAWLKAHRLESVWLLADYSFILFPGADCPCFIARYRPRRDGELPGEFEFITPKIELIDPREALIPVQPEDRKSLNEAEIIAAAERTEAVIAWKQRFWGTPRDTRLIDRLMRLPRLNAHCARPPQMTRDTPGTRIAENSKRWWRGQGFQPLTDGDIAPDEVEPDSQPWPIWWNSRHPFLAAATAPNGFVLLDRDQCSPYGDRPTKVRRTIAPELCRAPLLIINQACTKFLLSDFDVVFQHDFQSICTPKQDEDNLMLLSAFLASPLVQYLLFHTTANIGVERDKVHLRELMALPFPLPEQAPDPERCRDIVRKCASELRQLKKDLGNTQNLLRREWLVQDAQIKLNAYVYDYFDICEWERYLIEDTVELFRPSSTPASIDSEKLYTTQLSQAPDREVYANVLISTFKGWTRTETNIWAEGCVASKSGLALLTLGVNGDSSAYRDTKADHAVEQLLIRIRKSTKRSVGGLINYLRGFVFYEGRKVHLVKPLARRHWTRTAALNDADAILSHMMKDGGWDA